MKTYKEIIDEILRLQSKAESEKELFDEMIKTNGLDSVNSLVQLYRTRGEIKALKWVLNNKQYE